MRSHPTSTEDSQDLPASVSVLRNSVAGSVWTVVSRLTGLGRAMVVGAVLGATYLGNTYQAVNSIPNLIYYQLLAGSLFASLLVPPLIRHVDSGDRERAGALVTGFLGTLLLVATAVAATVVAVGPLVVRILALGVPDRAAAPALESLGMIAVLGTAAVLFGTGAEITHVSAPQLALLGVGTTLAVALHAACQWCGARSVGVTLLPRVGWPDPEVRRILRRIVPTLAFTGLAALQVFALMVVASRVRGGLVAFQLALNFFYLPTAVVTW